MEYAKPFLTFEQQADLLMKDRGMAADRDVLIRHLQDVGYYRLSGYWHLYKKRDSDEFWEGTTFQRVWDTYVFDRQFRLVVLDAVERVEVYMRTQLAYLLAERTGPFGFLDNANLPPSQHGSVRAVHGKVQGGLRARKGRRALRKALPRRVRRRARPAAVLDACERHGFRMVVTLFRGSPVEVRQRIAGDLGVSAKVLDSWLVTVNTVRNICAHHGRLWNRVIGNPPMIPKASEWHEPYEVGNAKMFGTLTVLSYLLKRVAPDTGWRKRLLDMVLGLSLRNQERMGFADGWRACPLWKPYLLTAEGGPASGAWTI